MSEIDDTVNRRSNRLQGKPAAVPKGRESMLAKSSTELVRQQNSALVLSLLRRDGALAHTEISERTGLASATVSAITAELERAGIIERREQPAVAARGRPRIQFGQRRDCGYLIVVTISSDVIQYSLVDYAGTLLDRFTEPRGQATAADFLASVSAALERTVSRSGIARNKVLLVSISSKGLVHPHQPSLVWSPVLGMQPVDFSSMATWGEQVMLNNETLLVAKALSHRHWRSDREESALAALSLGHSIGLGVARQFASGVSEITAPNFGHMLHAAEGALCRCGTRGCIEAYAGFYAILRAAFEAPIDRIPAKFVPLSEIEKIAVQARQGHRMARLAFRQAGTALGNGLSRLISLHGSMPIFVTGPGTRYYDLLKEGIESSLALSLTARLEGLPPLAVAADEPELVFQGHLMVAFSRIDQDVLQIAVRPSRAAS